MPVFVCGPKDKAPKGAFVVNTTSRSTEEWSKALSPFFLGPVDLYQGHVSQNVENAWQYAKVYSWQLQDPANPFSDPSPEYFSWAKWGWEAKTAVRYPFGKDAKPVYSYWDGKKLTYTDARKEIYVPLYKKAVQDTEAFKKLTDLCNKQDVWLWDFDGYNKDKLGFDYDDVINCPTKKMGHAFVLSGMIEGFI